MGVLVRWLFFVCYVGCFFVLPLTILWSLPGLVAGLVLTFSFLFLLGYQGADRVAKRLQIREISLAENPPLFQIVREYCRRLNIAVPHLGVIESPALNLVVFGFSKKTTYLAFTTGALNTLPRDTLAAVVGRELSYLWHDDVVCDSWLSQFLAIMEKAIAAPNWSKHSILAPRFYPFRLFLKQIVLCPLCLIPCLMLRSKLSPSALDVKSVQITRLPQALAEGLRLLQARSERVPFHVPFSSRHLFLLPPMPKDPLARIFFGTVELATRINAIERLSGVAQAT